MSRNDLLETSETGRTRALTGYLKDVIEPHIDQYGQVFFKDKRPEGLHHCPKYLSLSIDQASTLVGKLLDEGSPGRATLPGYHKQIKELMKVEAKKYADDPHSPRETVSRRSVLHEGNLYIFSGVIGRLLRITPEGWGYITESQVPDQITFKMMSGTTVLPKAAEERVPLDTLWEFALIPEEYRSVVLAFAIQSLIPGLPCPGLMFDGIKGSCKTSSAIKVLALCDPLHFLAHPQDKEQLLSQSQTRQVLTLDNISSIPSEMSNWICALVTGFEDIRRALYTDSDQNISVVQGPAIVTTIGTKNLSPDFIDRFITIPFGAIETRMALGDLDSRWEAVYPGILSSFYDLVVKVLGMLPGISRERLSRMADFSLTNRAVDQIMGTNSEMIVKGDHDSSITEKAEESVFYRWLLTKTNVGPVDASWLASKIVEEIQNDFFLATLPRNVAKYAPDSTKALVTNINQNAEGLDLLGVKFLKGKTNKGTTYRIHFDLRAPERS